MSEAPSTGSLYERIRARAAAPTQEFELFGERVIVRGMSAGERLALVESRSSSKFGARDVYLNALGCVLDPETGETAFSDLERQELLDSADANVIEELVEVANRLSGLHRDDEEDLGKDS